MARWTSVILLCLALSAAAVQADDITAALKKKGLNLAAAVWEISGVAASASRPGARWTAFAPTDAAVEAFLSDFGMTAEDLKKRPGLAREIIGVHLVTRHNVRAQELFAQGDVRIVNSAAGINNNLVFAKSGDKVTVTGAQGVTANIEPEFFALDEQRTFHIIDKVLLGSGYYPTFQALCIDRALTVSSFCEAAQYAGLVSAANGHTIFVPNNAAFVAAGINLGSGSPPAPAAVADILKYHVLAGEATTLPGVPAGNAETLAGKTLAISYTRTERNGAPVANAFVNGAQILVPNVYVGKAIVNGIGSVLKPGVVAASTAAAATSTAAPAAAATATASAATSSSSSGSSIKIGKGGASVTITLPSIAVSSRVQKPAVAVPAPAVSSRPVSLSLGKGRKLLGFGWGFEAGQEANDSATEDAILAAVNGQESTAAAADTALLGSEELSVPGDWNQVDNGVNPW